QSFDMPRAGRFEQISRGARRIAHAISGHEQPARESGPEVRFGRLHLLLIQNLNGYAALRVEPILALYLLKFPRIGRNPKRSAREVFRVRRKPGAELAPELLGVV